MRFVAVVVLVLGVVSIDSGLNLAGVGFSLPRERRCRSLEQPSRASCTRRGGIILPGSPERRLFPPPPARARG